MFQVGIVGCGGIGLTHIRSWMVIEGVKVVAVADLDPAKADAAAALCGGKAYTDYREFPKDLDSVSVVTPPAAHYPVIKDLLQLGYHVFSEKPLTMDVGQGKELDRLAKEKGRILSVGFKMRYDPIYSEAKRHLDKVGRIVSITTTKLQAFNPRPEGAWVKKTGAMYELSIHDFDLISFITGKFPQRVLFSELKHRFGWEKEDAFSIVADYGDGTTALLEGMYAEKSTFCFRDFTITILGDYGYMRIERPDRIILHTDEYRVIEVPAAEKSAFVMELEHFKNCVQGKETNTLLASDAVKMTELIEEARRLSV